MELDYDKFKLEAVKLANRRLRTNTMPSYAQQLKTLIDTCARQEVEIRLLHGGIAELHARIHIPEDDDKAIVPHRTPEIKAAFDRYADAVKRGEANKLELFDDYMDLLTDEERDQCLGRM